MNTLELSMNLYWYVDDIKVLQVTWIHSKELVRGLQKGAEVDSLWGSASLAWLGPNSAEKEDEAIKLAGAIPSTRCSKQP